MDNSNYGVPPNTQKSKMSLHRALGELKLIDKKIDDKIASIIPIGIMKTSDKLVNSKYNEADFAKNAKSDYDSIQALFERRNKIKCAVVLENAKTIITVGGVEMTIAEAINNKSLMVKKVQFLDRLKAFYTTAMKNAEEKNVANEKDISTKITGMAGGTNTKTENIQAVIKATQELIKIEICDPLQLEDKIRSLSLEYATFLTEVDATLSEANATTFIEV